MFAQVDAGVLFEFFDQPVHDGFVPVVAAEVGVAIGGFDFEYAVADFEHGDVECATTQVVNRDLFVGLFVEAVGEGGGRGFVHDAQHVEAGDFSGVFGSLALGVVEVSGNGDNRISDFFAEASFGIGLELSQNHGGDFRRAVGFGFAVNCDLHMGVAVGGFDDFVGHAANFAGYFVVFAAHKALDRKDSVSSVGNGLAFGGLAHEAFAIFGESNDGRGCAGTFSVFEHKGLVAVHNGHAAISCA